jgi:light-regulated signal transduction histidine kinase (bacteriophytochrome)
MRHTSVNLSAIADDVFEELQKDQPERKVDWHVEPKLVVEGDAPLLRVVLTNLLGNAWKYTGKTATAKIEFGAVTNADGATDFFVRDNGAGFDMAYAGKLFGAFQRLHTFTEFPGTGIGLATVQRIIRRHGGQVRGEGLPDKGATFYFSLPTKPRHGGVS